MMLLIATAFAIDPVPTYPVRHPVPGERDCPEAIVVAPGAVLNCAGILVPMHEFAPLRDRADNGDRYRLDAEGYRTGWVLEREHSGSLEGQLQDSRKAERRQRVRVQLAGGLGVVAGVGLTLATVWAVGQLR